MMHLLDKRADAIVAAAAGEEEDELLNTSQVADWFGVSNTWLEIGRHKGYGPPYVTVAPRVIRYLRSNLLAWLLERSHRHTAEYTRKKRARKTELKLRADQPENSKREPGRKTRKKK
jgi:hypothetical protein